MNKNNIAHLVAGRCVKVVTFNGETVEGYIVSVTDRLLTLCKVIINGQFEPKSMDLHSINLSQIISHSPISEDDMEKKYKQLKEKDNAISQNGFKYCETMFLNKLKTEQEQKGKNFHVPSWLSNDFKKISNPRKHDFVSIPSNLADDREKIQTIPVKGKKNEPDKNISKNNKLTANSSKAMGDCPSPQNFQAEARNREPHKTARNSSNSHRTHTENTSTARNKNDDKIENINNDTESVMFETMFGYQIPTISASDRFTIENKVKQSGVHIKHSNLIFSLRAFDWILKVLRKTYPNQYEDLTAVIICSNNDVAIDLGFSLAYLQNAQAFNVWVYVDHKCEKTDNNEILQTIKRHMRPGLENRIVLNIDYAPQPDFVVLAMNYNFKQEWTHMIKRLMHHMSGPTFVLDPPANYKPISGKSYTFCLIPTLPLFGMNEKLYTELILCNLAVPEEIIRQVVSNYASPFGIHYALSIKRVLKE